MANLHAALSQLRDRLLERIIWIDAICINQHDNNEKGQQVQSTTKIYANANRVIVWLGEAAEDSDQALGALRTAAEEQQLFASQTEKDAPKSSQLRLGLM
ncbi:heterokaryon incompatibility [Lasiosphaeria miniovina]|uniref:Heterokaryon incompatibility n=1 Tax=Lasiosphaeria miniovina TaxID=1954250 RepID=A0AA40DRR1_9PEZI|nr:heterokaryon incompatibility [Lasiosphaeria miniovina]KAK0709563.1 heterokaryon incompatibility [Lasiosphaeria miniovina]